MRNLVIWMKTILRACYRIGDCDDVGADLWWCLLLGRIRMGWGCDV